MVRGWAPDRCAAVLVVHHVVSDGIGTVAQVMRMLRRPVGGAADGTVRPDRTGTHGAGHRGGRGPTGDRRREPGTSCRPVGRHERRFGTVDLPLAQVRDVARRHGARVSDVLLSAVAGALRRVGTQDTGRRLAALRVAVPLMVREPGSSAEGNLTAAVMMDLPLGPLAEPERLADVAAHSRRLRTGTRALGVPVRHAYRRPAAAAAGTRLVRPDRLRRPVLPGHRLEHARRRTGRWRWPAPTWRPCTRSCRWHPERRSRSARWAGTACCTSGSARTRRWYPTRTRSARRSARSSDELGQAAAPARSASRVARRPAELA